MADEFYDGKPWVDVSEEELKKGIETFAGVGVQQTSDDVFFCRKVFLVTRMDASVPVDSGVFMPKRDMRKYLPVSGLTETVEPDGRQYTLKRGKVLVEVKAVRTDPLDVLPQVGKGDEM